MTRTCKVCNQTKPFSEFYNYKKDRVSPRPFCKKCDIKRANESKKKRPARYDIRQPTPEEFKALRSLEVW